MMTCFVGTMPATSDALLPRLCRGNRRRASFKEGRWSVLKGGVGIKVDETGALRQGAAHQPTLEGGGRADAGGVLTDCRMVWLI